MTGNEVGDRVHNFFAQDNLPQGQHHSQVADGSWASLNNNFWDGSQKQLGLLSSSQRTYNSLQSEFGIEDSGHPFTQTTLRQDFPRSQPPSQQHNSNGYMYGRQEFPARRDEANFLGVNTETDQYSMNQRGLFLSQSQQGGVSENIARNLVRSNTSDNTVSFDLFGGQQQMNGQQLSLLHGLPQQQPGFADMQQLQQLMFRKMQELHRQKELQQHDGRQQNTVNQVSSFARHASGGHPQSLIIGNPIGDASTSPWGEFTAGNTNWLQRASPAMNGTSTGPVFSLEHGQAQRSMGFGHQQVDQSMYGVPLSNSRGNQDQYLHRETEKTSNQPMPAYINSFSNHYAVTPSQTNMQDGIMSNREGFQGKNPCDNASGWSSNIGVNVDHLEPLDHMKQNTSVDEFQGPQELVGSEILHNKKAIDDAATLDPAEEKILFGSDDNIWDAFGTDIITGEGASNLLDNNDFMNGLPSVQSGSWSALMQSAVAETSSSDIGPQEELAGLSCQNAQLGKNHQTALTENLRADPAVSFGAVPSFDGANTDENLHNAMGFQLYGQELAYEQGEGPHVNSSTGLNSQSSGGSKFIHREAVQKPHGEGSQIYENSPHSLEVRMDGNTHWTSQQSASSQLIRKTNNWNGIESVTHSGERLPNLKSEQSSQHSQSHDWKRGPNDEIGRADNIWKVNSAPKSSRHTSDISSVNPASTQKNLEAFGRSLKPNNFRESYSLLNQMRAIKDLGSDPSNKRSKISEEPENFMAHQQLVERSGQPNGGVTVQDTTVSSVDSKMLSFLGTADNGEKSKALQLGNVPSRDMLMLRQNESLSYAHGNSISSVTSEHTQISPQMAPSWFNQYGTFKNGQIMPGYEMQKDATMKTLEQPFSHGNSSGSLVTDKSKELASPAIDTDRPGFNMQIIPAPVSIEHFSSPLPTSVSDQDSVSLGQKKRKCPHPWHEEVSQSSRNLLTLSMAEAEWAKAANRCIEKVEDNGEAVERIASLNRSKRRLVLTTQLMQQLLRPPPATILSADACSDYESLSYFVARLTLGDTCNLISSARSSSGVPLRGSILSKPHERTDDQHLTEVLENFMSRARKLENDLLSMDKRASVLDLRVECQDLEKFSIINRFAKFHGRGQPDGAKTSDAAANVQKPVPQRYVVAVPLPKNLPDRVQCLSLKVN